MKGPRLGRWGGRGLPASDKHIVLFVHGILADPSTFDELLRLLAERDPHHEFDFWIFNYDWRQSIVASADQLAAEIRKRAFGKQRRVDIVGHSMGGLVARLTVLRHHLPGVARIVTLATPNHGTISGTQLNLLGQMTACGFRRFHPIYARAPGVIELSNIHAIIKKEIKSIDSFTNTRLDHKSYVSIPAQYFHSKRQFGDKPPSLLMGSVTLGLRLLNAVNFRGLGFRVQLTAVHDGIVEERSNQLHPAPIGSSNEATLMARDDAAERMLHATHEAAAEFDHVTITTSPEVADLIQAVLRANRLQATDIDPLLAGLPARVTLRPTVV